MRPDEHLGAMLLIAVFEDRDSYYANAADPEQNRCFQQMLQLLEADPE